jgi:hypothetical protein
MRSRVVGSLLTLAVLIMAVCLASESAAQGNPTARSDSGVVLPITGTTSNRGTFNGLFTLQRFESRVDEGNPAVEKIVAVGVISGTVITRKGDVVGTVLTPVSLPVADPRPRQTGSIPAPSHQRAVWDDEAPAPAAGIVLALATCDVLNLSIGAIDLNVLGLVVHTDPIALEISGDTAGPLGAAICLVLNAVGSIVTLLNNILGLLGGLTGGLGV